MFNYERKIESKYRKSRRKLYVYYVCKLIQRKRKVLCLNNLHVPISILSLFIFLFKQYALTDPYLVIVILVPLSENNHPDTYVILVS